MGLTNELGAKINTENFYVHRKESFLYVFLFISNKTKFLK